jgi:hypothetical protein
MIAIYINKGIQRKPLTLLAGETEPYKDQFSSRVTTLQKEREEALKIKDEINKEKVCTRYYIYTYICVEHVYSFLFLKHFEFF